MTHPAPFVRSQQFIDKIYNGNLSALEKIAPDIRDLIVHDTSLHWVAACGGHIHILQFFIDNGARLADGRCNALCGAARSGHVPVIDWLHQTLKISNKQQQEALEMACQHSQLDAIKCLLRHGADLRRLKDTVYLGARPAIRAFFDETRRNAFAAAVERGCAQAITESQTPSLTKRALRTLGL